MKYKVGDKVVLIESIYIPDSIINPVTIDRKCEKGLYYKTSSKNNANVTLVFTEGQIDHEKTAELHDDVRSNEAIENIYQDMPPSKVRELLSTLVPRRGNGNVITETNAVMQGLLSEPDAIEPAHYRKGKIDLYEAAYLNRPFNEYRAIMEFVAERYIKRDKENRVEDLEKAIYTLERLKEKEEEHGH